MSDQTKPSGATEPGAAGAADPTVSNTQAGAQDPTQPNAAGGDGAGQGTGGQQPPASTDIIDDLGAGGDGGQDPNKGEDGGSQSAPEQYERFNFPEGMEMNDENFQAFSNLAKEMNLTQENAQKLVDFQSKIVTGLQQESDALINQWREESNKQFAGKPDVKTYVTKTFQQRPELGTVLRESGVINHPEVMKLVVDFGKLTSEDMFGAAGGATKPGEKSLEDTWYD